MRTFSNRRTSLLELRRDIDAARARVARFDRAEELVGLEDELAAEPVLVVDQQHANAGLGEFDGRRQAGRAAADDEALDVDRFDRVAPKLALHVRERREAIERLHVHPGADRDHARFHGQAVGDHGALRALAVGAEDALRRAVLGVMAERPHAAREQGRRDRFARAGQERLATPREGHGWRIGRRENGMFMNAMIGHGYDSLRYEACD